MSHEPFRSAARALTCGLLSLTALAATAGASQAASLRYFNYEPDSDAARYRTQDVTLVVRQGLLSTRVLELFRKRASPFRLHPAGGGFSAGALKAALPEDAARDLTVYAVDEKEGAPFARGACKGAERAWVALTPVKADRDLTIFVLTRAPDGGGLTLCETLAYRWRAEWLTSLKLAEPDASLGPSNSH